MKRIGLNLLFVFGLMLSLSLTTVLAGGKNDDSKKRPKNTGVLTVKTTPDARTVKVDGKVLGMSGVDEATEFYLLPGFHTLEVEGPNGKSFIKKIEIKKDARNCVCLKLVQNTDTQACPYNVTLEGPSKVIEGDLITFASIDALNYPTPLNYVWKVSPSSARVTSGMGTSAITVDTTGLGGQTINAELDVSDGRYAAQCAQQLPVATVVETIPPIEAVKFDEFESKAFDDDKARLDQFAIQLQNNPNAQGYIIMYQGTDKNSLRKRNVDTLNQRTQNYLVNQRGIDPNRITIINGGTRPTTQYELWLVPPGAKTPIPQAN